MAEQRRAIIVVDLAFGDCGKGTIVDFLTHQYDAHTVVRFNGGPQAGHNVVTADGSHHTFSQFGSGTFVAGTRTLLSRFMLIEPYAMLNEAAHLSELGVSDALSRLVIDERCLVIMPPHKAANRLRELARGDEAHGSCGLGIGELMQDSTDHPELMLHAAELADRAMVHRRLKKMRELKLDELRGTIKSLAGHPSAGAWILTLHDGDWIDYAVEMCAQVAEMAKIVDQRKVEEILGAPGTILFEGAQGILLDQTHGFAPHTTWSDCTFENAEQLLGEIGYHGKRTRLGVLRTYFTRHGAGPFVTEALELAARLPEPHNSEEGWQGRFRVGVFDAVAARYALKAAGGVDRLAITHVDRIPNLPARICTAYEADKKTPIYSHAMTDDSQKFLDRISRELNTSIAITSHGPTAADKRIS